MESVTFNSFGSVSVRIYLELVESVRPDRDNGVLVRLVDGTRHRVAESYLHVLEKLAGQ